jgi:hypothetical protein
METTEGDFKCKHCKTEFTRWVEDSEVCAGCGAPKEEANELNDVLATREERVKLLKAGVTGNTIENLYLEHNGFSVKGGNRKPQK